MPPEQTVTDRAAGLVLRAMINAAKADGQVDATERQRLVAKAQESGADPEAAAFLECQLERLADPDALAAEARDPVVAAQVAGMFKVHRATLYRALSATPSATKIVADAARPRR
jgi:uncharacterized membrane protein YebE (DUF533 family)